MWKSLRKLSNHQVYPGFFTGISGGFLFDFSVEIWYPNRVLLSQFAYAFCIRKLCSFVVFVAEYVYKIM